MAHRDGKLVVEVTMHFGWALLGLGLLGCGERDWLTTTFDVPLPFAEGQTEADVIATLRIATASLPPPDVVVSDALRLQAEGIGPYALSFWVDGVEITEAERFRDFAGGGRNLLWLTDPCVRQAPCRNEVDVRIVRNEPGARSGLLRGDYILTVNQTYTGRAPDPSTLSVEFEVLEHYEAE